jgi:hypothetical protein
MHGFYATTITHCDIWQSETNNKYKMLVGNHRSYEHNGYKDKINLSWWAYKDIFLQLENATIEIQFVVDYPEDGGSTLFWNTGN